MTIDPGNKVLRMSPQMRVDVAIRKGEQFVQISEFAEALKEYQRALDTQRNSSMAHYRVGEVFFLQHNYQSAANEFREALNGDSNPKWMEVWAHIYLGKIFDITGQRDRAVNEYTQAQRTRDNTQGAQDEVRSTCSSRIQRRARKLSETVNGDRSAGIFRPRWLTDYPRGTNRRTRAGFHAAGLPLGAGDRAAYACVRRLQLSGGQRPSDRTRGTALRSRFCVVFTPSRLR